VKTVDSDALGVVNRALGITGNGAQRTEFMDGVVDQTLDVAALVRRGRTQAGTEGIYTAIMRCINTDVNTISVSVDPYAVGTTGLIAPYPNPMPMQFDVWLLAVSLDRVSGSGAMQVALRIDFLASQQGWGIDNLGAAVAVASTQLLAFWDAPVVAGTTFGLLNQGGVYTKIGTRIPRGAVIAMSSLSAATSTYDCQLILGVFPTALGQDGIS